MSIELESLESAIGDFDLQADDDYVDPKRLSAAIDRRHRPPPGQALPRPQPSQEAWRPPARRPDRLRLGLRHLPDVAHRSRRSPLRRRAARPSAPNRGRLELRPDRLPGDRGHLPPQRTGGREARVHRPGALDRLRPALLDQRPPLSDYRAREVWDAEGFERRGF